MNINIGDIITLRGMINTHERPVGIVMERPKNQEVKIMWLNENIAKRFALNSFINITKLVVISKT